MDFELQNPIAQPSITKMVLTTSVYRFADNAIVITWNGYDANNTLVRTGEEALTPAEVQTYFDTPIQETGFRGTFVAAFVGAIQQRHGAAIVTA